MAAQTVAELAGVQCRDVVVCPQVWHVRMGVHGHGVHGAQGRKAHGVLSVGTTT